MPNAIYPKYKEAALDALPNTDLNDGVVKCALVDTATYTYSAAHEFLTSLAGVVGTAVTLTNTTVSNGVFDADNPTFAGVTGPSVEAIVFYIDTGVAATSRLVAYLDSGISNLPYTPNGGSVTLDFNVAGIFGL